MWQEKSDGYGCAQLSLTSLEIFGTLLVSEKVERAPAQEFVYHADREEQVPPPLFPPKLDGIIAHLTLDFGGNVHDKGIVNVTASGVADNPYTIGYDYHPRNAVDFVTDAYYFSEDKRNGWICYDFKERRVIPTSYSVKSDEAGGPGWYHIRS